VVAPIATFALRPGADALPIFSVAGPAAVATAMLLGTVATNRKRESRQRNAMKEALDAQILQDRVREAERYREMVLELKAQSHDAGNTLSSALINSEALLRAASTVQSDALPTDAREAAADLRKALERLSNILRDVREIGNRDALPRTDVSLATTLTAVLNEVSARFPRMTMAAPERERTSLLLSVYGGASALHSILSNLVLNACEGNGSAHASNVWIEVNTDDAAMRCEIRVADDGPGFSSTQLSDGVPVFETSKPNGSGLGLYTVERLVAANQGALSRRNRRDGGAEVTVLLPLRRTP
jgi:signal transduction histidine kinase